MWTPCDEPIEDTIVLMQILTLDTKMKCVETAVGLV